MTRTAQGAKLDSRTARRKLAVRRKPYYVQVRVGVTLGYERRDGRNGRWERRTRESGGEYPWRYVTLGRRTTSRTPTGGTF